VLKKIGRLLSTVQKSIVRTGYGQREGRSSNFVLEWLALLRRTGEIPISNLGPDTNYSEAFSW
jgi:hypothetical protein